MDKKQGKIDRQYDAGIEWPITKVCNLRCVYCWSNLGKDSYDYNEEKQHRNKSKIVQKINTLVKAGFPSAAKIIWSRIFPKPIVISVSDLGKALKKGNKIYKINLAGGEPFMVPNILEVCSEITQKHFLSFSTNLTSNKIGNFVETIDPNKVIHINASCHIKELERLNLMDRYIHNFKLCKEKGFNITAAERAYPPLLGEVEKYKEFFKEKGIDLRFAQFCGRYNGKLYPESYSDEEIKIFGLEKAADIKMFHSKGKLCNAGYNVCVVSSDGNVRPCYGLNESLGNIFSKIEFKKSLVSCPREQCGCPLNCYDKYLFEKALVECGRNEVQNGTG